MCNLETKRSGLWEKLKENYRKIEVQKVTDKEELQEELLELPRGKKKERMRQKIEGIAKRDRVGRIIFSKEVKEYLEEENQKEFENRVERSFWQEELEYILRCQEKRLEHTDLYFLVNEYSKEMKEILISFAKQYKVVYVLSKNMKYYTSWIERLEQEEISNLIYGRNYRKSLAKANLIINVDFTEEELKKFRLHQKAIILNGKEKRPQFDQVFNGLWITNFHTTLERQEERLKQFLPEQIYIARLERDWKMEQIWKKVKEDGVKVEYLEGMSGRIAESEYKFLC